MVVAGFLLENKMVGALIELAFLAQNRSKGRIFFENTAELRIRRQNNVAVFRHFENVNRIDG